MGYVIFMVPLLFALLIHLSPPEGCADFYATSYLDYNSSLDAIVVLGGGVGEMTLERVKKAAEVVGEGLTNRVVIVGGPDDVEFMLGFLKRAGIKAEIYVDTNSKSTVDNAYYAKKILRKIGAKRIGLVTSAFHMKRALATFYAVLGDGYEIVPIPACHEPDPHVLRREKALRLYIPLLYFFKRGDDETIKKVADLVHGLLEKIGW